MKIVFCLSLLAGSICAGRLLVWNIYDGARFARTMDDLRIFSQDPSKSKNAWDTWGNPYIHARTTSGDSGMAFIFSSGPDGRSEKIGLDPDDITPWTKQPVWLAAIHPTRRLWSGVVVSGLIAAIAGSSVITGRKNPSRN